MLVLLPENPEPRAVQPVRLSPLGAPSLGARRRAPRVVLLFLGAPLCEHGPVRYVRSPLPCVRLRDDAEMPLYNASTYEHKKASSVCPWV